MPTETLTAAVEEIASYYGASPSAVSIEFTLFRDGPWWAVVVCTPPRDKRRTSPDRTRGRGETLRAALDDCMRHKDTHRLR